MNLSDAYRGATEIAKISIPDIDITAISGSHERQVTYILRRIHGAIKTANTNDWRKTLSTDTE